MEGSRSELMITDSEHCYRTRVLKADSLDEIQTKVFRVFLLAIQSHLDSFA
jgi:hypothetical protein